MQALLTDSCDPGRAALHNVYKQTEFTMGAKPVQVRIPTHLLAQLRWWIDRLRLKDIRGENPKSSLVQVIEMVFNGEMLCQDTTMDTLPPPVHVQVRGRRKKKVRLCIFVYVDAIRNTFVHYVVVWVLKKHSVLGKKPDRVQEVK